MVGDVDLLGAAVTMAMQLDRKGNRVKTKTTTAAPLSASARRWWTTWRRNSSVDA
jgi:hypothetical protein